MEKFKFKERERERVVGKNQEQHLRTRTSDNQTFRRNVHAQNKGISEGLTLLKLQLSHLAQRRLLVDVGPTDSYELPITHAELQAAHETLFRCCLESCTERGGGRGGGGNKKFKMMLKRTEEEEAKQKKRRGSSPAG